MDGSNRLCLDFHKINKLTVFDAEPMLDQKAIMARLSQSKNFTKIDLSKGYWQIPLDEDTKEVTAFQTSKGLMQFIMMPFGLANASATLNRMMRKLFSDMSDVEIFVDDILIHTLDWNNHLNVLRAVLDVLHEASLTVRPSKTEIGYFTVEYLGSNVGRGFTQTAADKVRQIEDMDFPKPKSRLDHS